MMGFLDWLRKSKEQPEVDVARSQLINDGETILRILRKSSHASSMDFTELKYYFYRHKGLTSGGEQRILDALGLLAELGAIGWAGNRGDMVCFSKTVMPTQLAGLVK
jgi:hypothetical protein